jgi:tyramine---L-glutamate ligase
LKIIVYEHISGGGYAGKQISPSILSEGFGMLRTIVSDFKLAGHEVTVLLDHRLSTLNPPLNANSIVPVFNSEEPQKFLVRLAEINDAVYVIAPETGKILQSLVEIVEQTDKISLNCESSAIQKVADKTVLCEVLEKNGVATPKTMVFEINENLAEIQCSSKRELTYPLVFKPLDGTSCCALSIVKEGDQVNDAISKLKAESANQHFIVQEFIEGEAASVSLLCVKGEARAISLNQQNVEICTPDGISSYKGGVVPFDHRLEQEAFRVSEKAVECFPGLKGYVGVDLILNRDKPFVVDVNPRLTTSFVGLSQTAKFNVAEEIIKAVLKGKLHAPSENNGYVCFSKYETCKPTNNAFQKIAEMKDVVSPPFPLSDSQKACALISAYGDSLENANERLEEAKKHVLSIINRGI